MADALKIVAIDPNARQREAADPTVSAWVSASAGSGKTKVLTDRVLSLLLAGVRPERILCITFTRAAATEMAGRVNARLGAWATAPEPALVQALEALLGRAPEPEEIRRARRLFAQVLDAPGGLAIQTVHSFCQSLLGRFPAEAGVPPQFDLLDDRSASELMEEARDAVLRDSIRDRVLAQAVARITAEVQENSFAELLTALAAERGRLDALLTRAGTTPGGLAALVHGALGSDPSWSDEGLLEDACADDAFEGFGLKLAAESMVAHGTETNQTYGRAILSWLAAAPTDRVAGLEEYRHAFLTADGTIRKTLAVKAVIKADPAVVPTLTVEAERLMALEDRRNRLAAAEATLALAEIGRAMLARYATLKRERARLDYDDLILKARQLLTGAPGRAEWVLFKLDGGIEHILVDEAQDTNPDQWEVIRVLSEEFFAGRGQHDDTPRTVFAVGDAKQSIYSFQRADPAAFSAMRALFAERSKAVGLGWREVPLTVSFRSTDAVLDAVDAVFATAPASDGVVEPGVPLKHTPHRAGMAGRVTLWPLIGEAKRPEPDVWQPVVEPEGGTSAAETLAETLAAEIAQRIGTTCLPARETPLRAQDVMVLVRHRTGFVDLLARALQARGVPVAGVDRMVLENQIAVMDLIALAQALVLPQDDLTLATVLKGPFCGLTDADLMALAPNRRPATLWRVLAERAAENPRWAAALAWLRALRRAVDYVRPFELFAQVLERPCPGAQAFAGLDAGPSGWTGRQALLARLGQEAEDPLEEFLNLTLAFERQHPPSIQRFLAWFAAGSSQIKRDLEGQQRDEVRILTVHGAKGLQAPFVVLADTASKPKADTSGLFWREDGLMFWAPGRAKAAPAIQLVKEARDHARDQEYRRLLYVAMTRAEDQLLICGHRGLKAAPADCWHALAWAGLAPLAKAEPFPPSALGAWDGAEMLVLETTQRAAPKPRDEAALPETLDAGVPPPEWLTRPPAEEPTPSRPLTPSRAVGAEPAAPSPLSRDGEQKFLRGIIAHRLLQLLPTLPPERRADAARAYLARPAHGLTPAVAEALADEVLGVLALPELGPLFGPHSIAEAPISGLTAGGRAVSGQIDRLAVTPDGIWLADYKTLRPVPASPQAVPDAYLWQMAGYRALLRGIYPGRPIRVSLIFTDGPIVIDLPEALLDRHEPAS